MLRSVPMAHLRVQVPNRDSAAATRAIASVGLLHLVDIAHGKQPYDASPPGTRELYAAFRDLESRVTAVAARLGVPLPEPAGSLDQYEVTDFAAERERIALVLEPIEKQTDSLLREIAVAREQEERRREAEAAAERMRRAGIDADRLAAIRFGAVRLGLAPPDVLDSLAAMLSPAPFAIVPLAQEGERVFFAAATAAYARARLEEGFKVLGVQGNDPSSALRAPSPRKRGDGELRELREEHRGTLGDLSRRVSIATLLLQAQTFFAAAGRFVVISGWVPRDSAEKLAERIRSATSGRAIVDVTPADAFRGGGEGTLRAPILHRNPLLLRPFQKLVDLYGTPSYEEIQPIAFFAASFLLMFGLMFGDVGHGVVLFLAGSYLFRYIPRFLDYGILLMEAGASSTLFGVLYGSVFGIRGLIPVLWLEPMEELSRFMVIAIVLGIAIVSGGLVLNIINLWRTRDFRSALFGAQGAAGAVLYWIILVLLARAFLPGNERLSNVVIIALLGAAVLLLAGGRFVVRALGQTRAPAHHVPWWLGALEMSIELVDTLFSFFANTISFVRIAAFAAVHAGVFIAIFALADTIARMRFGGVLSIVVHVAANIVVILLEGLTVSVQVLRLEYYEFFGKFFRGGGERYKPLALGRGTEEEVRTHVS